MTCCLCYFFYILGNALTFSFDADSETFSQTDLHAEDTWRLTNVQILQAVFVLAARLEKNQQKAFRSAKEVYHWSVTLAG